MNNYRDETTVIIQQPQQPQPIYGSANPAFYQQPVYGQPVYGQNYSAQPYGQQDYLGSQQQPAYFVNQQ